MKKRSLPMTLLILLNTHEFKLKMKQYMLPEADDYVTMKILPTRPRLLIHLLL